MYFSFPPHFFCSALNPLWWNLTCTDSKLAWVKSFISRPLHTVCCMTLCVEWGLCQTVRYHFWGMSDCALNVYWILLLTRKESINDRSLTPSIWEYRKKMACTSTYRCGINICLWALNVDIGQHILASFHAVLPLAVLYTWVRAEVTFWEFVQIFWHCPNL